MSSLPHFITQMNKEQIWTPRAILSDIDGVVLDGDFKHRDAMNIVAVPLGAKADHRRGLDAAFGQGLWRQLCAFGAGKSRFRQKNKQG
ncbi:MAG: hypothetical protein WDO70_06945 [Alphaproteobacteria bacterium]